MANLNQNADNLRDTFVETRDVLVEIQKSLGKNRDTIKEAASEYRKLESIAQKFLLDQENLVQLSDKQVQQERDKAQAAVQEIKRQAERLMAEKGIAQVTNQVLTFNKDLTEEQKELLSAAKDGFAIENEVLEAVEKELKTRSEVNQLLGVTGNILKGVNELLGTFAKAFNLDAVSARMTEVANEIARGERSGSKLTVAFAGAVEAGKQLGKTLTDPAVVVGYIAKTFGEFEKANKEVRQLTGQSAASFKNVKTSLEASTSSAISLVDVTKTIASLSKEIGINVNAAFSPNTVLAATELTELMGISETATANLAMNAEAFGQDLGNVDKLAVNTVKSFAAQGKGALNVKQVLENAGGASQSLLLSFKGNNEELIKASANAAALGLTLGDVEKIADSLLDFESSIAAELEAELLTGKNLNLEKARTAALNNDMATVSEEIANNQEILSAFSSGNRIQQDAIAKSLGMSKDQVAKMIVLQKINKGMTDEQAAAAAGISVEEAKRLSTQESISKSLEKMAAAFAPILDIVAKIVSSKVGMGALMILVTTLVASKGFLSLVKGFKGIKDDLNDSIKISKDLFETLVEKGKEFFGIGQDEGGIGDKLKEKIEEKGGELADKALDKGTDVAGDAAESIGDAAGSAEGIKKDSGSKIKEFLEGLAGGLKAMASPKVLGGAAVALLASPGLIALGLAAPGLFVLSMIPGPAIYAALTGLSEGLSNFVKNFSLGDALKFALAGTLLAAPLAAIGLAYSAMGGDPMVLIGLGIGLAGLAASMFVVGKLSSQILQGSLALLVLGAALIPAAFAFSLLQGLDVDTMIAFSIALPLLALATAGLGFIAPLIMAGAAALVVLGLALIPAGIAFSMIAGLDTEAIISFATGVGILALTVAGLGFMAPLIIAGSFAIAALGLALIPLSMAFEKMEGANTEGLISSLTQLSGLAPGLTLVATSLFGIAAGLGAVSLAGFMALPVIGALTSLGLTGETSTPEKNNNNEVVKELQEVKAVLTQILNKDSNISIDSTKLGTAMSISSARIQ